MGEGKFIDDIDKRLQAIPDRDGISLSELLVIANQTANEHPLQYERFRIWVLCSRAWRWVTSKRWFGR